MARTPQLDPPEPTVDPDRPADGERRPLLLLGAVLVAVLVVALVLLVGVVRPPDLEPLTDPSFGGTVAFATWERDWCVQVLDADGSRREVRCDQQGGELAGWTEAGIVVRTWEDTREVSTTIEPDSGEVLASVPRTGSDVADGWWSDPDVGPVGPRDGRLEVQHGGEVLWSVEAADPYEVTAGWESPDGRWVLLLDSAERLLLVPGDGSAAPVVWAEDVGPSTTVVWRGTRPPGD